jgi:hypothetical protein
VQTIELAKEGQPARRVSIGEPREVTHRTKNTRDQGVGNLSDRGVSR